MDPKDLLLCLQEPTTGPCSEPDDSIVNPPSLFP
jgi:hypothetical protein